MSMQRGRAVLEALPAFGMKRERAVFWSMAMELQRLPRSRVTGRGPLQSQEYNAPISEASAFFLLSAQPTESPDTPVCVLPSDGGKLSVTSDVFLTVELLLTPKPSDARLWNVSIAMSTLTLRLISPVSSEPNLSATFPLRWRLPSLSSSSSLLCSS